MENVEKERCIEDARYLESYTKSLERCKVKKNEWIVYVLKSRISNYTYVGSTNNIYRRLRQHNGIIKGGAKSTRSKRPWSPIYIIRGITDRHHALAFEWALKHVKINIKKGGCFWRKNCLNKLLKKEYWTSTCDNSNVFNITVLDFYHEAFIDLPENIKLKLCLPGLEKNE